MPHISGMEPAYQNAVRTIAESYQAEVDRWGGKSLSRVATIVVNNGGFFSRLREGRPFSVTSLDKFAAWFRQPANWPDCSIPHTAATALASIGRPPLAAASMPPSCRTDAANVRYNDAPAFDQERGA